MKKKDNKLYDMDRVIFLTDIVVIGLLIVTIALLIVNISIYVKTKPEVVETVEPETVVEKILTSEAPEEVVPELVTTESEPVTAEPEVIEPIVQEPAPVSYPATDAEIELLALVTMAEAEGEPEEGKRLVIDTVLNRVDAVGRWPNTISEVIYQPGQFVAMSNGRAERCRVTEEVRQLVREELLSRTNTEVVYFTAGGYGRYGTPVFQVGNHYFCK